MESNKNISEKPYPYKKVLLFYVVASVILLVISKFYNEIWVPFSLPLLGSLVITLVTQILHKWLRSPHVYEEYPSIVIRSTAGYLEMLFYVFTITFGWLNVLTGFLALKILSVWKSEEPNLEGASTGILRIAVVLSLLISIFISVRLSNLNPQPSWFQGIRNLAPDK